MTTQPFEFVTDTATMCVYDLGAAEETTSEIMGPYCTRGGLLVEMPVGTLELQLSRSTAGQLLASLLPGPVPARNSVDGPLRLVKDAA